MGTTHEDEVYWKGEEDEEEEVSALKCRTSKTSIPPFSDLHEDDQLLVLQPEPPVSELQSERSIYFDTTEGTWKCHHCTWIYPTGNSGIGDLIQHPKAHCSRGVMNVSNPLVLKENCFSLDTKGTESINGTTGMKDNVVSHSIAEKKLENGDSDPMTNGIDTTTSVATEKCHSVAADKLGNGESDLATNGGHTVKSLASESTNEIGGMKEYDFPTNGVEVLKALAIESINGTGEISSVVDHFSDEQKIEGGETDAEKNDVAITKSVSSETNDLSHTNLEEEQSGVHLLNSTISSANEITILSPAEDANLKLVEESKQDVAEWDVERVINEQETHDLYCPNCHSCITRKVILRKRKRTIQNLQSDTKREKLEIGQSSSTEINNLAHETALPGVDASLPVVDNTTQDHVDEPDVFRCLSCFSFFIPSVSIFKSFRIFRDRGARESAQNVQQIPVRTGAGEDVQQNAGGVGIEEIKSQYPPNDNGQLSLVTPDTNTNPIQPFDDATSEPQEDGKDFVVSSTTTSSTTTSSTTTTSVIHDTGENDVEETPYSAFITNKEDDMTSTFSSVTTTPQSQVSTSSMSVHHVETRFDLADKYKDTSKRVEGGYTVNQDQPMAELLSPLLPLDKDSPIENNDFISKEPGPQFSGIFNTNLDVSQHEIFPPQDNHIGIRKDPEYLPMSTGAGKDVIVVIERDQTRTEISQSFQNNVGAPTPVISTHVETAYGAGQRVDRDTRSDRWDILKSIVYGGLLESITSLSIVSSAAGGGAGTLNIVALGMANLFGGLFIIAHGLVDLKREEYDGDNTQATHMDRYHELLGNKRRFTLHATVAILSYIIFGIVSPLTYGFSFRVTDNREYKLIAVAIAALVCITLLAIAKAYVQKPPKTYAKTLFYYVSIGVMSTGVSYVAGVFVKKLLERLGLFEASGVNPAEPSGFMAGKSLWAAY